MTRINYKAHSIVLGLAAIALLLMTKSGEPVGLAFLFRVGLLHSASVAISVRDPAPLKAAGFITLATLLSFATGWVGLVVIGFSSLLTSLNVPRDAALLLGFVITSAIGGCAYRMLIGLTWLEGFREKDLPASAMACCLASLTAYVTSEAIGKATGIDEWVVISIIWWIAFSAALYWTETRKDNRPIT